MKAQAFIKAVLVILAALASSVVYYCRPDIRLDTSWMVALNYFAEQGIRFGSDLVWTYGPLGFLLFPVKMGPFFAAAIAFQLSLWLVFVFALMRIAMDPKTSVLRVALFTCIFLLARVFISGFDYYIVFIITLLFALALIERRWLVPYVGALVLSVLLWFIKFNTAIIASGMIAAFIVITAFYDKDRLKAGRALAFAAIGAIVVAVAYLAYLAPLPNALGYFKGVYELISNYSTAMSLPMARLLVAAIVSLAVSYGFLVCLLYRASQRSFAVALMAAVPLAMALRSSCVRGDSSHVFAFLELAFYQFALIFLFTDIKKTFLSKGNRVITLLFAGLSLLAYTYIWGPVAKVWSCAYLLPDRYIGSERSSVASESFLEYAQSPLCYPALAGLRPGLLGKIGNDSVSVFPIEAIVAIANGLNYVPFPVIQIYSAYTPYLDKLIARFLETRATAPEYIIFRWQAIDGRHPLLDVPAAWLSIYRWYDADGVIDRGLLLKHRVNPRFGYLSFMESRECAVSDAVKFPKTEEKIVAFIRIRLNAQGKLRRLFFKIPVVAIELFTDLGGRSDYRVIPETLQDGLLIPYIPTDIESLKDLLEDGSTPRRYAGLKLCGPGLAYYEDTISVEYYRISTDIGLKTSSGPGAP